MFKLMACILMFCGGIAATVQPSINVCLAGPGLLAAGGFFILRR